MTQVSDGICIVTGASSGLGRALSVELCRQGTRVVGLARSKDGLSETQDACSTGLFQGIETDVSDPTSVAQAFAIARETAPVTRLINNAASYPRKDFLDETPESFMVTVATNLGGVVAATHEALKDMVATGQGRILNVSTFADLAPIPASSAYATSKGAARIFSRALIADLGDRFPGIVINDWMPGMLATEMGIADGLPPETAAKWGAKLALWQDPSLTGTIWEMDREIPPARSLKRRLAEKLRLVPRAPARRL